MPTLNDIKNLFTATLVTILVLIILFQKSCTGNHNIKPDTIVETKIDTIWKTKVDTVTKTVKVYHTVPGVVPDLPEYKHSDDIDTCRLHFDKILKELTSKNIYKDTIKLNQLGTVQITDTIWLNKLQKRTYIQDIKIPTIEKTITIIKPADPVKQLYIGGNIFTTIPKSILVIPSLIYKDRQDRIYQINCGLDNKGNIYYGGGLFWKIKLHK